MSDFKELFQNAPTSDVQEDNGQDDSIKFDEDGTPETQPNGFWQKTILSNCHLNLENFRPSHTIMNVLYGEDNAPYEDDEQIVDEQGNQILGSNFADREEYEKRTQDVKKVIQYYMELVPVSNVKEVLIDEKGKMTDVTPAPALQTVETETTEDIAEGDAADESAEDNKKDKKPKEPQKARKYTNQAEFYKANFGKPVELNGGGKKKLFIFLIACVVTGIFFAVEANSYYVIHIEETPTALACSFAWLTVFDTLKISLSPMNMSVIASAFAM